MSKKVNLVSDKALLNMMEEIADSAGEINRLGDLVEIEDAEKLELYALLTTAINTLDDIKTYVGLW